MRTSWEGDESDDRGYTRREWAKLAIAAGAASSIASVGGTGVPFKSKIAPGGGAQFVGGLPGGHGRAKA